MFERAECCGILPVRVNSHHNKLHLISNKFSKVYIRINNRSILILEAMGCAAELLQRWDQLILGSADPKLAGRSPSI